MPHLAPHSPTQPYVALHSPTQPYVALHSPTQPYLALQSQTQSYIIIWANLCRWTSSYNSTLPSSLHDKHAPLKKTVIIRQRSRWFNSDIKGAARERRKAERKWRNTNSQQDFRALKVAHNHTTYLMNSARRNYFSSLIAENSSNQRKLFRTTNSLLCELSHDSFPDHIPPDDLANNFGNYFVQKIGRIYDSLNALQSSQPLDGDDDAPADSMDACANCVDPDPRERAEFPNFKALTQDQVSLIIGRAVVKSCPLDPAPTSVVLQVLDVLLPVITCMINTGVNLVCSQRNEGSPRIIHVIEEVWSIHRVQKPSPSKQSPRRLQVIRKLSYDDQRQSVLELQSAYKKTKY